MDQGQIMPMFILELSGKGSTMGQVGYNSRSQGQTYEQSWYSCSLDMFILVNVLHFVCRNISQISDPHSSNNWHTTHIGIFLIAYNE